jgi:hypothetical protein
MTQDLKEVVGKLELASYVQKGCLQHLEWRIVPAVVDSQLHITGLPYIDSDGTQKDLNQ